MKKILLCLLALLVFGPATLHAQIIFPSGTDTSSVPVTAPLAQPSPAPAHDTAESAIPAGPVDFNPDYTKPANFVIGGITVTGTKFLDQHVLINLSGLVIGDSIEVPGEKISSAIRNLWKQGLFADARIAVTQIKGDQVFLEIQ